MSLSPQTIEVVNKTAAVVAENAEKITQTFYTLMLGKHPELFQFFNRTNQRTGRQADAFGEAISPQAKTLAQAIIGYASNIEQLQNLSEPVARIANKHCALGIQAAHYQIVHDNLMEAIGKVLGAAVTAEIAAAWSDAVMHLAKIFIGVEAKMYEQAAWSGPREFTVARLVEEATNIKSFHFEPVDGKTIGTFVPSQYVTIFENPSGEKYFAPRHYTITSQPGEPHIRITVKRLTGTAATAEPAEDGIMSNYLHSLKVGDVVHLGPIFGPDLLSFTDASRPVALVSVGIGFTPTVAMFATISKARPGCKVFHGDHSPPHVPLLKEVEAVLPTGSHLNMFFAHTGGGDSKRMTGQSIVDHLDGKEKETEFLLCCGDQTKSIVSQLVALGIPSKQIHCEFFGPQVPGL